MQITIQSCNNLPYNVTVDAISANGTPTRVSDVLADPAVLAMFGKSAAEIVAAFSTLNGNAFPAGLRDIVAASAIADGMVIGVDLPAIREAVSTAVTQPGAGQPGTVMLYVDGGMITVRIGISNGQHNVYEAIHNQRVKSETNYDDTRLSACTVMVNDVEVPANQLNTKMLWDGDKIVLSPNTAHTKGN